MAVKHSIVFLGTGPVAADSLQSLIKTFDIEAVITKAVPLHHRGIAPVEELAKAHNLPLLFANTKNELDDLVRKTDFLSSLGVIVDHGVIVSQEVIDSFLLGIVNSHFSLLPQWRGADPITFSILSGQQKTGVSLMLIEPTLDTGKLITQKTLAIAKDETTPSLTDKLVTLSNELLDSYLPRYIEGKIIPHAQPHPDRATFSRKLTKQDGILDITKPAIQLEREIRAYDGWPKSRITAFTHTVIVTKAHVSSNANDGLFFRCGDGNYLVIDELTAPSGKRMTGEAFLKGYAK